MQRTNLIHQYPVEAAASTMFAQDMFGRQCPKTELANVGRTDALALAGGRI